MDCHCCFHNHNFFRFCCVRLVLYSTLVRSLQFLDLSFYIIKCEFSVHSKHWLRLNHRLACVQFINAMLTLAYRRLRAPTLFTLIFGLHTESGNKQQITPKNQFIKCPGLRVWHFFSFLSLSRFDD